MTHVISHTEIHRRDEMILGFPEGINASLKSRGTDSAPTALVGQVPLRTDNFQSLLDLRGNFVSTHDCRKKTRGSGSHRSFCKKPPPPVRDMNHKPGLARCQRGSLGRPIYKFLMFQLEYAS